MRIVARTPDGVEVELSGESGQRLMEVLKAEDIGIDAICGGMRSCATCHVHVAERWLNRAGPRGQEEEELLGFSEKFCPVRSRLSCQIILAEQLDGIEVDVVGS